MRTILLLVANTLRVVLKRKSNLLVYLVLPVLGIPFSLAVSASGGSRPIRVGVVSLDTGPYARELVTGMESWGRFAVTAVVEGELERRVAEDTLDCGLVLPAGWGESVFAGSVEPVRLVSVKGEAVTAWLEQYVDLYTSGLRDMAVASAGDRAMFEKMYAASREDRPALSRESLSDLSVGRTLVIRNLGYFVMFLMLGASMTTQLVLAEKRSRTFHRVRSAPVQARQYVAGNGLSAFVIIVAQIILVQILLKLVVRSDTGVPDLVLFAILVLFGLVAVALGMAITAFSRSTTMANALTTLILSPTCMLAGCFWPIDFMPAFLQRLALFLPQRWVLNAVQTVQEGGGLAAIGGHLLVIVGFALALGLLASYRMSRMEESGQFV